MIVTEKKSIKKNYLVEEKFLIFNFIIICIFLQIKIANKDILRLQRMTKENKSNRMKLNINWHESL